MLDMRGKKKKTTWEKWEAGAWLPRSPIGATRHAYQCGQSLGWVCRTRQRKIYPTEYALKKAILSMLPKTFRTATIDIREWGIVNGDKSGHLATVILRGEKIEGIGITKHSNGWSLRFGDDTIRSFAKEVKKAAKKLSTSVVSDTDLPCGFTDDREEYVNQTPYTSRDVWLSVGSVGIKNNNDRVYLEQE